MLWHTFVFALTISSFHGKHAQRMFPHTPIKYEYISELNILKELPGSIEPLNPPSVLVARFDDDNIFRFLHRNYTLTKCGWDRPMLTVQKVVVFKELVRHLQTNFNQTIHARFIEADDMYAWLLSGVAASDF